MTWEATLDSFWAGKSVVNSSAYDIDDLHMMNTLLKISSLTQVMLFPLD